MIDARIGPVLERSRALGFLGPGPVAAHVEHSLAIADLIGDPPSSFLDLGSGGGVPGLVLALRWERASGVLLDAMERRTTFLREAVADLGLEHRVSVVEGRAEMLAREPSLRGAFPLVVARGFAPPPVVAECAAGFLEPGGYLVVTEPPDEGEDASSRWSAEALAQLGMVFEGVQRSPGTGIASLLMVDSADERWPRRVGIPAKRPLW
jgi:16S rRNA (guanine527-N7)-methyltransferase